MADKYTINTEFISNLDRDIFSFIEGGIDQPGTDDRFNELALRLFAYQFSVNIPYQKYCEKRGIVPGEIDSWEQIPAVPTEAFKVVAFTTFPPEQAVKVFMTSGTSDQKRRGKTYLDEGGLKFWDLSYQRSTDGYIFPVKRNVRALLLSPSPQTVPAMALAYGISIALKDYLIGTPEYLITPDGLNVQALINNLKRAETTGEPIYLSGASFGFANFFGSCLDKGFSCKLPPGSILCHGGGYKGKSREMSKEDFVEMAHKVLGIQQECIVDVLGLTEVSAIFVDNVLRNHVLGITEERCKPYLPWTRTIAVDPDTLERLPKGESGLLRHYCLSNRSTVLSVQTDDLGYEIGKGFEITGRARGAEARGCSIAVDEILSAAGK